MKVNPEKRFGHKKLLNVLFSIFNITGFDTSAGGLSVPEGIISSVVSASVLTRFNKLNKNCPFIDFEIIIKLRFQLPQAKLALDEIGYLI